MSILVFDLDDTLIPSAAIYARLIERMNDLFPKLDYQDARRKTHESLPKSSPSRHHRLLYYKVYLENKSVFSASKALEWITRYEELLFVEVTKEWKDSPQQHALHALREQGSTLVALTNETLRTQLLKLSAIDPEGTIFDKIITSEEVGYEKPHPYMFERVENLYPNRSFCMIGDSLENDIEPARQRGWDTIQVDECTNLEIILRQNGIIKN